MADFLLVFLLLSAVNCVKISNYPTRQVEDYRSYSDITILQFRMPEKIHSASWNFTAREKKTSFGFSSCKPRPLTAYLKFGSIPVVNPDDSKFPDFYYIRNETLDEGHFLSDEKSLYLNVTNPAPGDWFVIVFSDYTDPDYDGITQSGLSLMCIVLLEASIDATFVEDQTVLLPEQPFKFSLDSTTTTKQFSFFVPDVIDSVCVKLRDTNSSSVPRNNVIANLQSTSRSPIRNSENTIRADVDDCEIAISPTGNTWYYLTVSRDPVERDNSDYAVSLYLSSPEFRTCNSTAAHLKNVPNCWSVVPLTRQTYVGLFEYGYERTPSNNGSNPANNILLVTDKPTLLSFIVNPLQDNGGTLSFEISLDMSCLKNILADYHVKIVACLSHEVRMVPQFDDTCVSNDGITYASQLQVNTTSETNKTCVRRLHVPFPEYGTWFLTLLPFCFERQSSGLIETVCTNLDTVNMTFILASDGCDPESCGRYGKCVRHMSSGVMYAACMCYRGYRGWGCTDDSKVTPDYELLVAVLLLTISNIFFLPAIVISIRREYYTEALVYTCTMFFSTFYHACDGGGDIYSFCIIPSRVLQFCDFYSAVLSLWVTIIAMANLRPWLSSLAHVGGATIIALGAEYNRTSLWMFLLPLLIGLSILGASWGIRMRRRRSCYPQIKYWKYYLPPGLLLIVTGLACFAFLQTERNYKYVHSFWHAVIAVSILIILPKKELWEEKPQRDLNV